MAVPSGNNHLRNTSGGAFTEQTQGGTVLGNQTTGSIITKALSLVANSVGWASGVLPRVLNNGLSHNQKALSAGTFAYAEGRRPIHKFRHDFGAKLLTKWRANQFSWVGTSGARHNWVDASNAAEVPATLSTTNMYDISDGNASDMAADSAAEPTRAIPGELVLKVDFVTTNVSTGGDFFDYKPITG